MGAVNARFREHPSATGHSNTSPRNGRVRRRWVMKVIAFVTAGLVAAAAALTPVPAEAQRYGHGYGNDRGYHDGYRRDYRRDRRWRDHRGWRGDRGYRGRTRCVLVRGYYGPQRQCYRVR